MDPTSGKNYAEEAVNHGLWITKHLITRGSK